MEGLSVGAVARRLGVSTSTVRSWERRYGLGSGGRSDGGHRRYGADEVAALERMHALVLGGETPARAAQLSRVVGDSGEVDPPVRSGPGGPGGRVLAVPGAGRAATGLARAATRLDAEQVEGQVRAALAESGTLRTWDELLRPVLVAAGAHWASTGTGIEVEHLLSEVVTGALRLHRDSHRPARGPRRPVLLACAPQDQHSLVLHVVSAALAERGVASSVLGSRVPVRSLAVAASRTGAPAVFIWSQMDAAGADLAVLPVTRPPLRVVVGGPGWQGRDLPPRVVLADSLAGAVDALTSTRRS